MSKFIFQEMTPGGMPFGQPVSVSTVAGLILQCPYNIDSDHVKHMAEIARQTPDYPCDISIWKGQENNRTMIWTARIYWSNNHG